MDNIIPNISMNMNLKIQIASIGKYPVYSHTSARKLHYLTFNLVRGTETER